MVRAEEFDFDLPGSQIAQFPAPERDASRLLVLHRSSEGLQHWFFRDLPNLLRPTDLLVLNDSQVIAARLCGVKRGSGGKAELLLIRPGEGSTAAALVRSANAIDWLCLGR